MCRAMARLDHPRAQSQKPCIDGFERGCVLHQMRLMRVADPDRIGPGGLLSVRIGGSSGLFGPESGADVAGRDSDASSEKRSPTAAGRAAGGTGAAAGLGATGMICALSRGVSGRAVGAACATGSSAGAGRSPPPR